MDLKKLIPWSYKYLRLTATIGWVASSSYFEGKTCLKQLEALTSWNVQEKIENIITQRSIGKEPDLNLIMVIIIKVKYCGKIIVN
jgi:hypothetical protein